MLPEAEIRLPRERARPPRLLQRVNIGDSTFNALLWALAGSVLLIAGVIVFSLWATARPAFKAISIPAFIAGQNWDPVQESFGALPFIFGTLVTSGIAILITVPVAVGLAIFLVEMAPSRLRPLVSFPLELLAGIPSVVYGLWGVFVLVPRLRDAVEPLLGATLGFLPLFRGPPIGFGYLAGGLILSVMILPTVASVSIDVLRAVPASTREAALALGATRWEAVRLAVIPYSRAGIFGAILLGLGRALGETMAVTMVIGNSPEIHASLFAPGYSLPAVIANEFAEATSSVHAAALAALALILFGITLLLNSVARLLVRAVARGPARFSA
jgi:phosphate transport system permease protein